MNFFYLLVDTSPFGNLSLSGIWILKKHSSDEPRSQSSRHFTHNHYGQDSLILPLLYYLLDYVPSIVHTLLTLRREKRGVLTGTWVKTEHTHTHIHHLKGILKERSIKGIRTLLNESHHQSISRYLSLPVPSYSILPPTYDDLWRKH